MDKQKEQTKKDLVVFFGKYLQLINAHITGIEKQFAESVDALKFDVDNAVKNSSAGSVNSKNSLINAHLNPDDETMSLMEIAQKSVDDIFSEAMGEMESKDVPDDVGVRRSAGQMSKKVEAISQLNTKVKDIADHLFKTLSEDESIRLQLKFVCVQIGKVNHSFRPMLVEYDRKYNFGQAQKFAKDILVYLHALARDDLNTFLESFGENWSELYESMDESNWESKLIETVQKFVNYLCKQLDMAEEKIRACFAGAMSSIYSINDVSDESKLIAHEIYVKSEQEAAGGFVKVAVESEKMVSSSAKSDRLKKTVAIFEKLNALLGAKILEMMGKLSNDDVIGQRLANAKHVLSGVPNVIEYAQKIDEIEDFASLKNKLLQESYDRYTSEVEKVEMKEVFPDFTPLEKVEEKSAVPDDDLGLF